MIKVSQLYIQNVGPFEGETFDFSVEEGHPDIHIFTGQNGSGKTTILHGLASNFNYKPLFREAHKKYIANDFYKRFHFFEDENDSPKSLIYSTIFDSESKKIIDEATKFGCSTCKGLHSNLNVIGEEKLKNIRSNFNDEYPIEKNEELDNYLINTDEDEYNHNYKFKFATFGYSGYRFIESESVQINKKIDPFKNALEFKKNDNENSNIPSWIASTYSKIAIASTEGNQELAKKYRTALDCLMNSIHDLTEGEFTFKIKTTPWDVVAVYHDKEIEFDTLPDGLRSVLSWMGDLLMRLDAIPWEDNNIPVNHQNIILLLDEIEVHLHPKWQYQILPLTQKIFPNAQIFLTTHSPFIINSIDNAKIHKLKLENGVSKVSETRLSDTGESYSYVYKNILDTTNRFAADTEKKIAEFNKIDAEIVMGDFKNEEKFKKLVGELVEEGEEVISMIGSKLYRLERVTGKDYLNGKN